MPILSSFGGLSAIGRGQRAGGRKRAEITISANTDNYALNTAKVSGYEAGNTDVILTINSGVVVGSASTGSAALTVSSWNSLDTITIINNGSIRGAGGLGAWNGCAYVQSGTALGVGGSVPCCNDYSCANLASGSVGGPAMSTETNTLTLINYGTINGGGGGAGAHGGNNQGGGSGASGGNAITKSGGSVYLQNQSGATIGGGGGGGAGWGNRNDGASVGGGVGQAAYKSYGDGNFGVQGASGLVATGSGTSIYSGAATVTL